MSIPDYRLFDPQRVSAEEKGALEQLAAMDKDRPLTVRGFTFFSLVVQQGFRRVNYAAETRETDNAYFWITNQHAEQIGRALKPTLKSWALQLTTFEGDGFDRICDLIAPGVHIEEVTIAHKSADEVTPKEAAGLARMITKLHTQTLHLWAGEYAPGALDVLAEALVRMGNRHLVEADVCDVSKPEPEDRIRHPHLEAVISRNRHG